MYSFPCMQKVGFVSGKLGLLLCLYYFSNQEEQNDFLETINKLIKKEWYDVGSSFDLGYGLSGFCLALQWIDRIYLIEDQKRDIDNIIEQEYKLALTKNNLDYFTGASGYLFYFLVQDGKINIKPLIQAYVRQVDMNFRINDWYTSFKDSKGQNKMVINMGTPHGITGILLVLLIAVEKGYKSLVFCTIQKICEYLLQNRMNKGSKSLFPSIVEQDGTKRTSGIAWCYGDLMISYAFLKVGILLNEPRYTEFGWNALTQLQQRTDYVKNDLCLCHGHSSLMIIYKAAYTMTNDASFHKQSLFWYNKTISVLSAQIKNHQKDGFIMNDFFRNPSLINGLPGCLLSLLSYGTDEEKWTKYLLL